MQEISWLDGEEEITAIPTEADPLLSLFVQEVNDHHCTHTQADSRWLCAECSTLVRATAARTRHTALDEDTLTCTIYLAIARRLGIDDPDLRRRGNDHPLFLAREITDRLANGHKTPETAHTVIDWWSAFVRVRTGRIVGLPSTTTGPGDGSTDHELGETTP